MLNNPMASTAIAAVAKQAFETVTEILHGKALDKWAKKPAEGRAREHGEDGDEDDDDLKDFEELESEGGHAQLGDGIGRAMVYSVPDDIFAPVVGFEYEKAVLRQCWSVPERLNVLMVGPPGCGKSLLLEEMLRLDDTRYMVARTTTPIGLRDVLLGRQRPRLIGVEEIEKGDRDLQGACLTAADGKVSKDISGTHTEVSNLDTRFVFTANSLKGIIPALQSRCTILEIPDYTPKQRHDIIKSMLIQRHGMSEEAAEAVAKMVAKHRGDVRDGEQIGIVYKKNPELAKQMAAKIVPLSE